MKLETLIEVDRKIPLPEGGTDQIHNLVPVCANCNLLKGSCTYEEFMKVRKLFGEFPLSDNDRKEISRLVDRLGKTDKEIVCENHIWKRSNSTISYICNSCGGTLNQDGMAKDLFD